MAMRSAESDARSDALAGLVVGFDIDNTLHDPTGQIYRESIEAFVSWVMERGDTAGAADVYESFRSKGYAIERLGLASPIHEREHPEVVAVFCLAHASEPALLSALPIDQDRRPAWQDVIVRAHELYRATRTGSFSERLGAEIAFQRFVRTGARVGQLVEAVRRLADHPRILALASSLREQVQRPPMHEPAELLNHLRSMGANVLAVSKGRSDIQRDKLARLGLLPMLAGRALITQDAGDVPGRVAFDAALARLIDGRAKDSPEPDDPDLPLLWHAYCVLDAWSSKTPSFYGRCLHAIRQVPDAPSEGFTRPVFLPDAHWREAPLRFVMVGDRYDIDVEPLIDLLGPGVAKTLHLRAGKYADVGAEEVAPASRRADHIFANWDALAAFMTDELSACHVEAITSAPPIVPLEAVNPALIEAGLRSQYETVRIVAVALATRIDRRAGPPSPA